MHKNTHQRRGQPHTDSQLVGSSSLAQCHLDTQLGAGDRTVNHPVASQPDPSRATCRPLTDPGRTDAKGGEAGLSIRFTLKKSVNLDKLKLRWTYLHTNERNSG